MNIPFSHFVFFLFLLTFFITGGPCFNCGHYPTKHCKIEGEDEKKKTSKGKASPVPVSKKKVSSARMATSKGTDERKKMRTAKVKEDDSKAKEDDKSKEDETKNELEKLGDKMLTASWAVDPKEITLIEPPLGEGTFAKVYKGPLSLSLSPSLPIPIPLCYFLL
jgi:hypothetical protein